MPAKPSGQIKIRIVHQTQKNGDIYVLERRTIYDPEKKYNKVLSSKLISKIPKGEKTPVPTRPKSSKSDKDSNNTEIISAKRNHIGMMDIIDHIGKVSGIDDAVYASADTGTTQKIISLARYLLATNGQSLPGILTWQFNHPIPYTDGITEDIYHNLFVQIGSDEGLQQRFFSKRCEALSDRDALAYDSSTISTYSENQNEARYGFNKAHDGLKTIKLLTLYSIESRQPVAFTKQPGNLPDVISVTNAIRQLNALGVNTTEIITDNGYYSEHNFAELLLAGFKFITLAKTSIKWIRSEIDSHMEVLNDFKSLCPFDHSTHGISVPVMHEFEKTRKYANHKSGAEKGSIEKFSRRIYINIYFNLSRQNADKIAFENDLYEIKTLLEEGTPIDELSPAAQEKARKYFTVKKWGSKLTAVADNKAEKQHADGTRTRVWNADTLRGRMFVQFVSLCYYEYFSEKIRKLKTSLESEIKSGSLRSKELKTAKKLKAWINNTPLYLQLQWFDTIEQVEISSKLHNRRWNTETTACDNLYLQKIGIEMD